MTDNKPLSRHEVLCLNAPFPLFPPISPILSLCKYGPASEEVGQGSDDWRLGTIFPRYFLPLRKKIFPWWNSLITDRGGGRGTPALLWTKLCACHQIWEFLRHAIAHFAKLCAPCKVVHLQSQACILAKKLLFAKTCSTTFIYFHRNMYLHKCNCT